MREYATPLTFAVPDGGNLLDDPLGWAREEPERPLFSRRTPQGWVDVSAGDFITHVRAVAKGLVASGVEPGDRVAVLSKTRYEWTLLDYAIWYAGGVSLPIYETSSAAQIEWILSDSAARALVVESEAHQARLAEVRDRLPELHQVWSMAHNAIDVLVNLGADIDDATLEARRASIGRDTVATLIYTSGTTGQPKGCTLTHGMFDFELRGAINRLPEVFTEGASTLLFLPLAHVFARIIQIGCVKAGVRMGHASDIKTLMEDFAAFQPTFILAVPRVFEKIFNAASQRAAADGRGGIFDRAAEVAINYSRSLDAGRTPVRLKVQHALFDRLVYAKLRHALGGRCTHAISGGAPLGERLGHFYRGIGANVLEGYGLTETAGALSVNTDNEQKIGSVGRPLPGTEVKVAGDGELLFRGRQIFVGYWNNPAATSEALSPEGWFHTGDLGEIDDEGFVRITGRKKEILVTAGGKNVAPAVLEDRLRANHLIDQCLVVGDGQPYIAALITLDHEALASWAERVRKIDLLKQGSVQADPDLRAEVQKAVDSANRAVSQAESIRKFVILDREWTEEGGQLTPSLKLKRNVVMRESREEIAAIYAP